MNYYIICDAGGTKADFILFDGEGHFLARHRNAGANAIFIGVEASLVAVINGIQSCLSQANLNIECITSITLFIPGFRSCIETLKKQLHYDNITLQGDEENAFYGALGKKQGIVVLSGTGSFASGKDGHGNEVVCGGWGPMIGDYGSGYHIGAMCMSHVAQLYDEGKHNTILELLMLKELGIETVPMLRHLIYKEEFSRSKVADLCKTVAKAAQLEDETALLILEKAAHELVALVTTIAKRINGESLEVSLIGGVTQIGPLMTQKFQEKLLIALPQAKYVACKYSPVIGGVLYVLANIEGCNIEDPMIIQNIEKEVDKVC